jgi:hypothetical protein
VKLSLCQIFAQREVGGRRGEDSPTIAIRRSTNDISDFDGVSILFKWPLAENRDICESVTSFLALKSRGEKAEGVMADENWKRRKAFLDSPKFPLTGGVLGGQVFWFKMFHKDLILQGLTILRLMQLSV